MAMCRACLCTDNELKLITEDFVVNYNLLTQLEVQLDKRLPRTMCHTCWDTVVSYVDFRNKCIKSEALLQSHFLINGSVELVVKQNVKFEEQPILNVKAETLDSLSHSPHHYSESNDDYIANLTVESKIEEALEHESRIKCRMKAKKGPHKRSGKTKSRKEKKLNKSCETITMDSPVNEERTKLPCGLCEKSYTDRDCLYNHLEDHRQGTTCSLCEEIYKPWPRLLGHRLNHIGEGSQSHCHMCWEPHSVTDYVLEYHYYKMHYDGEFPGLECKQCCKTYPSAQRLKRHIWAYHSSKQYICDHCSKVYHNKHHLSNHLINHSDEKRYFCDKCDFACKLKGGLTEHQLRKHTDVKYKCNGCHAKFANQMSFEKHKTKCQTYVICPTCGRSMNKTNLIQHLKSHSDEKPYKCDRCTATYKSKRALQVHADKHHSGQPRMGEKRFVCTMCDKRYTANHNLKIHLKTHRSSLLERRAPACQLIDHS